MIHSPLIDSALTGLFRFRTRGFLRMEEADGTVPPAPGEGGCYLYVHIPFCEALCPFCSFHRVPHRHGESAGYFAALRKEILLYHAAGFRFGGVYFGGGTPTIEPEELLETIGLVRRLYGVREISVETNPRDLRPELLGRLRGAGVTRLSVGVQSFDDGLLRQMGRLARYGGGAETAGRLRAVAGLFPTLNVDLIFNLPGQTQASLTRDLEIFRTTGANQVSCYPLMPVPGAGHAAPDRRRLRSFYQAILAHLPADFTSASAWCFHRRGQGADEYVVAAENYAGVGSGAFSYIDGTLYATSFSLGAYGARVAEGRTGIVTRHRLGAGDRMRYSLLVKMFGLGLDRAWALRRHGPGFLWRLWGELRTLEWLRAARRDATGWRLTPEGMYWLMLMMAEFFNSVAEYREAMRRHVREEEALAAMPRRQARPAAHTAQACTNPL